MLTLHLEIVTIERKLFDDQVSMVIAPGTEGLLGILPRHTPLLTSLTFGELQVKQEGEEDQYFAVGGGFMEVQPFHVVVMADTAERAEEIDVARAEEACQRAEGLLARAKEDPLAFAKAETDFKRAQLRLKVAEHRRRKNPLLK